MKLWDKGADINKHIEKFTVGRDRELDLLLAPYDVLGSLAHITMLQKVGLLNPGEYNMLAAELKLIYMDIRKGNFIIDEGTEDVHSQIEFLLTKKLGETGKKIHSARSRNDQVLVDLKLFTRAKILNLVDGISSLFSTLIDLSSKNKDVLMPGYTHLQVAMPSSFGLWFGAYAESLVDDLALLNAVYHIVNQNPLGSAAGYGSSFPIDRQMTTDLLGFDSLNYNVVYAQMGRGKIERMVSFALGNVSLTLSKLAYDCCLFMSQNFGFIELPDDFTTGSSIMPHKKNPDVFELLRAKCNKIASLTNETSFISNNLPSGYFRDYQILKESFLEAFDSLSDCLAIANYTLCKIKVNNQLVEDDKYRNMFSVEEVNRKVLQGVPFREAYRQVGEIISNGNFNPEKTISHTHEGSIGNLCNEKIINKFNDVLSCFNRERVEQAENDLLK